MADLPTNQTSRYLQPWSTIADDELKLFRELYESCQPLSTFYSDEVLLLPGGKEVPVGRISEVILKLRVLLARHR